MANNQFLFELGIEEMPAKTILKSEQQLVDLVTSYLNDEKLTNILTIESLRNDSPNYLRSHTLISNTKSKVTKELENISSLCEEETIKNLIDKDKLSNSEYYYDFYLDLMYTEKDLEMLNSTKEEMEILSTKLNEFLDKVDEILTFLETNANYIEYTDTDIYISDDNILNEYNNLIEELTTLANNMANTESDI